MAPACIRVQCSTMAARVGVRVSARVIPVCLAVTPVATTMTWMSATVTRIKYSWNKSFSAWLFNLEGARAAVFARSRAYALTTYVVT